MFETSSSSTSMEVLFLLSLKTNDSWASLYVFICHLYLFGEMSVQIFCSFFFILGCLFSSWVGRIIYIFWLAVLYLIHICRIFSPVHVGEHILCEFQSFIVFMAYFRKRFLCALCTVMYNINVIIWAEIGLSKTEEGGVLWNGLEHDLWIWGKTSCIGLLAC